MNDHKSIELRAAELHGTLSFYKGILPSDNPYKEKNYVLAEAWLIGYKKAEKTWLTTLLSGILWN